MQPGPKVAQSGFWRDLTRRQLPFQSLTNLKHRWIDNRQTKALKFLTDWQYHAVMQEVNDILNSSLAKLDGGIISGKLELSLEMAPSHHRSPGC